MSPGKKLAVRLALYEEMRGMCPCGGAFSTGFTAESGNPVGDAHRADLRGVRRPRSAGVPRPRAPEQRQRSRMRP